MKETAQRAVTACRKVRFLFCASCDSTQKIEFAQQIHKNRGRVPRFSYFKREKVSVWELSDDFGTAYGPFLLVGETVVSRQVFYRVSES